MVLKYVVILGGATLSCSHDTSVLWEVGEIIEKNLHIQIFLKLVEIVLGTIYFHKTI